MPSPGAVVTIAKLGGELISIYKNMNNERKIAVGLENRTQVDLIYYGDNLSSGRWEYTPPDIIKPGEAGAMGGEDRDSSILTGIEGYVRYDTRDKSFCVVIGFGNPGIGAYKCGCRIDSFKFTNIFWGVGFLLPLYVPLKINGTHSDYKGRKLIVTGSGPEETFSVMDM